MPSGYYSFRALLVAPTLLATTPAARAQLPYAANTTDTTGTVISTGGVVYGNNTNLLAGTAGAEYRLAITN
ncbi:hypothetical protein [Hymenobacter negativus]|uniref:T9SS C-terminal target domain-containing protein n=1 Tax=Hymenobacter negativus TaxID=2795026 RepID=A0ABS3QMR2_9BACT|nr:hypothetical protein [Hymenobacter negativus]MBO2012482.1 hypothetical protein [Hymenobacter negativus]